MQVSALGVALVVAGGHQMIDCHQGKMDWSIAPKQLVALTGPLAEM